MAYTPTEDYYNQYKKQNKADKDKALADIAAQGIVNEALINEEADNALETAEKTFTENAMSAEEEVGLLREKNAINRALNERYINERMANLGLSNSGYAKASMMGAEAGYQNTAKGITEAEQKSLDTLAAALRESKTETEDWRAQEIAKNTANMETEALKVENQYEKDAEKYAEDMVKKDNSTKIALIQLENKLNKVDEFGDPQYNDNEKKAMVSEFLLKYGADSDYLRQLGYENVYYSGWGQNEWKKFVDSLLQEGVGAYSIAKELERLKEAGILDKSYATGLAMRAKGTK